MIERSALLADAKRLTAGLVDDLRARTEHDEVPRIATRGTYDRAVSAGRTQKTYEEWREDLLAQVAAGWVLASVFVRFCEDNGLVADPLLSGPGQRLDLARDHRSDFFARQPTAGDREWLEEVYGRYQRLPAVAAIFGERNPLWQLAPSADGARAILDLWWSRDAEGHAIRHDFTDPALDTRFLGDLYQDLSPHARQQYALLQTPDFIESFLLDRTLDPAIDTFGLAEVRMIDPTCGSGHFLLGAFHRLLARWRTHEPATGTRRLVERALKAVHGVDANPFAVEIARFRLSVAALQASGERRLEDLPDFHLNLAVGDSLLHGMREGGFLTGTIGLPSAVKHHYPTEDAEEAERILVVDYYHVVVGNPPYITVKDAAMNNVYRSLYTKSCHRQYSMAVPFKQRFFQLAVHGNDNRQAGFVGMITANSFMKREFGTKIIEDFLPTVDLTHVIDTSGAYIPGHGTPTVILLGRDRSPTSATIRAVLGIRGEPGRPAHPANGMVWSSIYDLVDAPDSESAFVSVVDIARTRFQKHPWSLQGGTAPALKLQIESSVARLDQMVELPIGRSIRAGADEAFMANGPRMRNSQAPQEFKWLAIGEEVRDWAIMPTEYIWYPYPRDLRSFSLFLHQLNDLRTLLSQRSTFQGKMEDAGLRWWEYMQHTASAYRTPLSIVLAFVATHNHFVLDRGGKVFNRSAPVIKLSEGAGEDAHLELLGLLNSSTACFWMKQVFYPKGGDPVGTDGARVSAEGWDDRYEFDSTKLKQFPLPAGRPLDLARALDRAAQELGDVLPAAGVDREAPLRKVLEVARERAIALRARMVRLQEELDWRCYKLYGLLDEDLTFEMGRVPLLERGQRAFEIALARRMAAGEEQSTWFERHGSTPITELPAHWPDDYRALVERRLEVIEADRGIRLLERPEYKRRWNWEDLGKLEREAQRTWLLDRVEALLSEGAEEPIVTTCARLADRLAEDADAVAVAQDLAGTSVDLVALVTDLVQDAGVPYLAAWRYSDAGLRTRVAWERTWDLQRVEDRLEARTKLAADDPQYLSEAEHAVARKEAGVDRIPVPPKYKNTDFRSQVTWRLRGKLDVPKERFVLYPGTRAGADGSPVVGWAGWDHLGQARALAAHYTKRKEEGAELGELTPLLAGVAELLPWLLQWHDEPDPVYGERMGQFFAGFLSSESAGLGVTTDDLRDWRPPAPTRGRRKKESVS